VSVLNGSNLFYYQPWPMTVGPLSVAGHFLSALTEQEIFRLSELDRTRVVHLSMTPALCNFLTQIRQPHMGTVAFN